MYTFGLHDRLLLQVAETMRNWLREELHNFFGCLVIAQTRRGIGIMWKSRHLPLHIFDVDFEHVQSIDLQEKC